MKLNYCPNCGTAVHGQIRFCSKCGVNFKEYTSKEGDLKGFLEGFLESNADIIKELTAKIEKGEPFEQGMFFAVEMKGDKPVIKQGKPEDFEKIFRHLSSKPSFKKFMSNKKEGETVFKETKGVLKEETEGKYVEVDLPQIKEIENVSIIPYEEGIEVAAKKGDNIYFSKIPIKDVFTVGPSRLDKGKLIIEIR